MSTKGSEGYLFVDHRASPGLPKEVAIKMGLDPTLVSEGKVMESTTLTCAHCGTVVIVNPYRLRERGHCFKCMAYICDACEYAKRQPEYVHMPMVMRKDLVKAGKLQAVPRLPLPPTKGDVNG